MGHFYGARNGDVVISPKKVNLQLIQAVNACFEAKFTPIIDYRQIFLMCILYVAVELIVDRKQYERQICMRSHCGIRRAAGTGTTPCCVQPGTAGGLIRLLADIGVAQRSSCRAGQNSYQ